MSVLLSPGTLLGDRYKVEMVLGQGGMGAVYLASDMRIPEKKWAIKELWDFGDPSTRQLVQDQFQSEASILAKLDHPNLPRITDYFLENNKKYLVMDVVEGETLEDKMQGRRGPLEVEYIIEILKQLVQVLEYLHLQEPAIVFRDLKPANIMVSSSGKVKLIDFGIARIFTAGKQKDTIIMGTPGYAAPEQYGTGQSDPRSDIYGLGSTLYFCLTGQDPADNPFHFENPSQLNPKVYKRLEKAILKCVQMDPARRFASVKELENYLFGAEARTENITTGLSGTLLPPASDADASEIEIEPGELNFGVVKRGSNRKKSFIIKGIVNKLEVKKEDNWLKAYPSLVDGANQAVGVTVYTSQLNHGGEYHSRLILKGEGIRKEVPVTLKIEPKHLNLLSYVLSFIFTLVSLVPIAGLLGFILNMVVYNSVPRGERKSLKVFYYVSIFAAVLWIISTGVLLAGGYYLGWFDYLNNYFFN